MATDELSALLDHLQSQAHCSYLSDLHSPYFTEALVQAVRNTRAEDFSQEAWRGAVRYITGVEQCGLSSAALAELLLAHLAARE